MTTLKVLGLDGKEKGSKALPVQFSETIRSDLIKRAVESIEGNTRQPYGAKPGAGMRQKGKLSRRRHDWKGAYGIGISRIPRKIMSHNGTRFNWVGAVAPGTVGGRQAHPPKAIKIWAKKINVEEKRKAIRSALSASLSKDWIAKKGHVLPQGFPFIVDSSLEKLKTTKSAIEALEHLGFSADLTRAGKTKTRGGNANRRGRKTRTAVGPLVVVSKKCDAIKAVQNIPGVDVCLVSDLNCSILAPGSVPGRLTIYTEGAIDALKNLFVEDKQ